MSEYDENIDFFKNLEADFKTSEEDLWNKIDTKTQEVKEIREEKKTVVYQLNPSYYAVAASLAILLSIGLFLRFYTINLEANKGEQLTYELPDGSKVLLNAASTASYKPYWWNFKRELKLSGEAFFQVAKGEKFSVISVEGTTTVLGTSFNIFARDQKYKVFCKTGKVSVSSNKHNIHYLLSPGELAQIDNSKKSGSKKSTNERDYLAWTYNKFSFTNAPLSSVFKELERQYNIQIEYNDQIANLHFGAYFDKPDHVNDALDLVTMQFRLKFEKTGNRTYRINEFH
jgi:ferric-dicitrate binding protein FerR (iron transport regulator)